MKQQFVLFMLLSLFIFGCNKDDSISFPSIAEFNFDFHDNSQSWEGDFADYPVGEENFYELSFEFASLPVPLSTIKNSLKQSGNNHSDDLFMFVRKKITGLQPNSNYQVSFEIEFATNIADDQFGVGGSPGEGVTIKAGATILKPEKVVAQSFYKMNIDKGNQTIGGSDMVVVGDFSNDTDQNEYTLKTLIADRVLLVTTNNQGELWVIIGTDSGYEATTTIYYNTINIEMVKQ